MRDVGVIVMLAVRRALSDPSARRRLIAGLVESGDVDRTAVCTRSSVEPTPSTVTSRELTTGTARAGVAVRSRDPVAATRRSSPWWRRCRWRRCNSRERVAALASLRRFGVGARCSVRESSSVRRRLRRAPNCATECRRRNRPGAPRTASLCASRTRAVRSLSGRAVAACQSGTARRRVVSFESACPSTPGASGGSSRPRCRCRPSPSRRRAAEGEQLLGVDECRGRVKPHGVAPLVAS